VHLRPRLLGVANSLSAVRVRGRRAVVKDVGVRPPIDGPQAAADDVRQGWRALSADGLKGRVPFFHPLRASL